MHPAEVFPYYKDTRPPSPKQYKYPSLFVVLLSGAVTSGLTFIIDLFSLWGTTRLFKRIIIVITKLFEWIIKGFKDE